MVLSPLQSFEHQLWRRFGTQGTLRDLSSSLVAVVFVFLWHGIPKAFNPAMAMEKFVSMGFPGFLGPIVGWAEVIGGVLLLIGLYHKYAN